MKKFLAFMFLIFLLGFLMGTILGFSLGWFLKPEILKNDKVWYWWEGKRIEYPTMKPDSLPSLPSI